MSRMEFESPYPSSWRLGDIDKSRKEKAPQIADRIREAVAAGVWRQGAQLPGTHEIARRYGVSVTTVQVAVQALAAEGVLRHAGRRGYFVRGVS